MVKDLLANAGDMGSIPGSRRSTGGGNDNPVQYFRWKIPWAEEPGGLHSMESQNVRHSCSKLTCTHARAYMGAHTRMKLCSVNNI